MLQQGRCDNDVGARVCIDMRRLAGSEADLQRSSHHPEYGTTTLAMILHTYAAHDLDHTIQAETALMQPLIPHTGHWRWEFAAKEMSAAAQVG